MTSTTERPAQQSQWFKSWFDSPHYHRLYANRDESEAAGFIDRLVQRLRPDAGAEVLDLGCGAGRHSRQLASRGLRVTGIDLAARSIEQAKRSERPGLRFLRHDMRVPFGKQSYDYVFNFFTSFGYFELQAEHLAVVGNMAAALKADGALVLDYLNVRHAEGRTIPEEIKEIAGVRYRLTRWADARHFFKRIVVEAPSAPRPLEYVERVAKFTLADFRRMFALHGLTIQEVYGDYHLNAYDTAASPRLILMARRAAQGAARAAHDGRTLLRQAS